MIYIINILYKNSRESEAYMKKFVFITTIVMNLVFFPKVAASTQAYQKQPTANPVNYSPKDFRDDKKKAETFQKKEREKWLKKENFSEQEHDLIKKVNEETRDLTSFDVFLGLENNQLLKLTAGRILEKEFIPILKDLKEEAIKKTAEIDRLFERGIELEESTVVHKNINIGNTIYPEKNKSDDYFRNPTDGKIREYHFGKFENLTDFSYFQELHYFSVFGLNYDDQNEDGLIKLELTVPGKTKVIFREDGKIILPRGFVIKIKEEDGKRKVPTVVTVNGKEFLSVEAELAPLDSTHINSVKESESENITKEFNELLKSNEEIAEKIKSMPIFKDGLPKNFIELDLSEEASGYSKFEAYSAIEELVKDFDPEILIRLIEYMSVFQGKVTFTNKFLPFSKTYDFKSKSETIIDWLKPFFNDKKKIIGHTLVNSRGTLHRNDLVIYTKGVDGETLKHEMGHVLDNFINNIIEKGKGSSSEEFKKLYVKESTNALKKGHYGLTNVREYWAELVRLLYASGGMDEMIKQAAPESCKFILDRIDYIKKLP